MDKDRLEDIWKSMLLGETDILVCTTIIETGVDVPNANTLIIEDANRMGVSQLHQIRGRVGRSTRKAYAYLTYKSETNLSDIATKRLEAIREYTEIGSGFRIAMRDLELRGAGNILGTSQSGHMDAIGYELYVRILENAVLELRGKETKEKNDCVVSFTLDAYIPESYIDSDNIRMEIYKKIAEVDSQMLLDDLTDEILDRFGVPPKCVENLMKISLIRNLARNYNVESIVHSGDNLKFIMRSIESGLSSFVCRGERVRGRAFFSKGDKPTFSIRLLKNDKVLDVARYIINLFTEFSENVNNTQLNS
jgi:transcription-repair coupling factor (superfamily II helicase)